MVVIFYYFFILEAVPLFDDPRTPSRVTLLVSRARITGQCPDSGPLKHNLYTTLACHGVLVETRRPTNHPLLLRTGHFRANLFEDRTDRSVPSVWYAVTYFLL